MTSSLAATNFSTVQQETIHSTATQIIAAALTSQSVNVTQLLGDIAGVPVDGIFVTLKRNGRLRGCCGTVGRPQPLATALANAAQRTAIDDQRFPPVAPRELPFLTLDVSLLFGFEDVTATGQDRLSQIEIGRHGVRIQQGDKAALLLPNVAPENHWDAQTLLKQVCLKAKLPASAWAEENTKFVRFESQIIEHPIDTDLAKTVAESYQIPLSPTVVKSLAEFAHKNMIALFQGAVPGCFRPSAPDPNVNGLSLKLVLPHDGATATFSQLVVRGGLPLQTSLLNLCGTAARWLKSIGLKSEGIPLLKSDLALLHSPSLHGTVADFAPEGINPAEHALLITESDRRAWWFDQQSTVEDLLDKTAQEAQVNSPEQATVMTLAISSSCDAFFDANVPQPVKGPSKRPAAVAGRFYPNGTNALTAIVRQCLGDIPESKIECSGFMVPHAGLQYSGQVAADVWKKVKLTKTVIIISPKHTRNGAEWAVAPNKTWALPNGTIESDHELAQKLVDRIDGLHPDAAAHAQEHGIEVQLPLLHALSPQTQVVGITIGGGDFKRCARFGQQLALALSELEEQPLLIISSDMNHYATDEENRVLDEKALAAIETLDPRKVFDTVTSASISMCGLRPAVIVMEALLSLDKLDRCQRMGYATSGDVTGDLNRVVGYAGMVFSEE